MASSKQKKASETSWLTKDIKVETIDLSDDEDEVDPLNVRGETNLESDDLNLTVPDVVLQEDEDFQRTIQLQNVIDGKICTPEGPYRCQICNREYKRDYDYEKHVQICRPKIWTKCAYCEQEFKNQHTLRDHLKKIHKKERPPCICEECGKGFYVIEDLASHKMYHIDLSCKHCGKSFKNRRQLKKHEDIHSDTSYVCTICGSTLNTMHTLKKHMIIHSDKMRYKCNYCGKEFKLSGSFKLHLMIHAGLKPHQCRFCDKKFTDSSVCRTHMKNVHFQMYHQAVKLYGGPIGGDILIDIPTIDQLQQLALTSSLMHEVKRYKTSSVEAKPKKEIIIPDEIQILDSNP